MPRPSARPTPLAPRVEEEAPTISIHPTDEEPVTISSRPTLAEAPRISSPPVEQAATTEEVAPASFGRAPNEKAFFDSAPRPGAPSLRPGASLPPPRRPRSRARSVFAKVLFVTMFAGVAALLGLAIKTKYDAGALSVPSALQR